VNVLVHVNVNVHDTESALAAAELIAVGYEISVMHVAFTAGKAARPPKVRIRDREGPRPEGRSMIGGWL
jgi:hypothetical protein